MSSILVIDDTAILLDLIANTLRLDGHKVIACSNPLAALDYYQAAESPIDLLLTDIDMKPISGFELIKRVNNRGNLNSSVLFMSGYTALSGAVANSLGDRAILEKPFTALQLRAAVRKALPRSQSVAA